MLKASITLTIQLKYMCTPKHDEYYGYFMS